MNFRKPPDMTAMTAFLRKTVHGSGKEEKRPQWWLYNGRSRRGWYSDTPLKTDDRGDALKFPPTTLDNISACPCVEHSADHPQYCSFHLTGQEVYARQTQQNLNAIMQKLADQGWNELYGFLTFMIEDIKNGAAVLE